MVDLLDYGGTSGFLKILLLLAILMMMILVWTLIDHTNRTWDVKKLR